MAWSGNTVGDALSWFGTGFGKIADPNIQPAWCDLEIDTIECDGVTYHVRERRRILTPFAALTEFDCESRGPLAKCLIVMAQSGHFSLILRDLAAGLLSEQDVSILDWTNARHVPPETSGSGFDESIATIVMALQILGPRTHLIGVCQSAIPAIVATLVMHQTGESATPASLTLIGAPIEPRANPTRVSSMLASTPIADIEGQAITVVPDGFAGAGRKVFAALMQQRGLLTYLGRHFWQFGPLMQKVISDDGADPQKFPFLTSFTSLKDIPERAFLESIAAIYQNRLLWSQDFAWNGQILRPDRVTNLPLMTIEAEQDDIAAPGQTCAAHKLFRHLPDAQRRHFVLNKGGHFSLFHGTACRNEIVPAINRFLRSVRSRSDADAQTGLTPRHNGSGIHPHDRARRDDRSAVRDVR